MFIKSFIYPKYYYGFALLLLILTVTRSSQLSDFCTVGSGSFSLFDGVSISLFWAFLTYVINKLDKGFVRIRASFIYIFFFSFLFTIAIALFLVALQVSRSWICA